MFMNEEHPSFADKPHEDAKVWRYMDLARYLSLLQSEALHFARADQMSDRWEGSYSGVNVFLRPYLYGEHHAQMEASRSQTRAYLLQQTHMSCWHLSEVESAAMWEIYQREGRGVAVQSTWGRLTSSITSKRVVHGGRVKYVNYSKEFIPEANGFDPFMHKRESFSYEKEARLLMMTGLTAPDPARADSAISLGPEPPVIAVTVDLRRLVETVFVAPGAPEWVAKMVLNVTGQYNFEFEIRHSDLAKDPIA